jgi:hypothetical protein
MDGWMNVIASMEIDCRWEGGDCCVHGDDPPREMKRILAVSGSPNGGGSPAGAGGLSGQVTDPRTCR